jgi:lipopolysaccharide export system permease protein
MKKSYIQMKTEEEGQLAKDLILVTHNQSNNRLSLVTARKLRMIDNELLGKDVAIITHLQSETEQMFDPLVIENQSLMTTEASTLSSTLKKNRPRLDPSALEFPMLRLRSMESGKIAKKAFVEILRRITLSVAVFSFTLLGCAYGIEQGRNFSKKNLFKALGFTMVLMMSYLLGKEFKGAPWIALTVFSFPHILIWIGSALKLKQIARGRS